MVKNDKLTIQKKTHCFFCKNLKSQAINYFPPLQIYVKKHCYKENLIRVIIEGSGEGTWSRRVKQRQPVKWALLNWCSKTWKLSSKIIYNKNSWTSQQWTARNFTAIYLQNFKRAMYFPNENIIVWEYLELKTETKNTFTFNWFYSLSSTSESFTILRIKKSLIN